MAEPRRGIDRRSHEPLRVRSLSRALRPAGAVRHGIADRRAGGAPGDGPGRAARAEPRRRGRSDDRWPPMAPPRPGGVPGGDPGASAVAGARRASGERGRRDGRRGLAECRAPGRATCRLEPDGTLTVVTGVVDLAGSLTILGAIAAESFGVPFE